MLYSKDLEQHLLSGLLKYPEKYFDISAFIDKSDFFTERGSYVNQTIFIYLKDALENKEPVDSIILAERLRDNKISFRDNLEIGEYLQSLERMQISKDSIYQTALDLKRLSVKRSLRQTFIDGARCMEGLDGTHTIEQIISKADQIYNEKIDLYTLERDEPQNLYERVEYELEKRCQESGVELGFNGPHPTLHSLYGSLLRPGNITTIVARTGVGKTSFCLDFATKVSRLYDNVPVLHFDNGEMSPKELIFRLCSSLTGIPLYLLEHGSWKSTGYTEKKDGIIVREYSPADIKQKINAVYEEIKEGKFFYYNVGGMSVEEMINKARRFYYSEVGRGNPMILSFDYIKNTYEQSHGRSSWEMVGQMVDSWKRFIQRDILSDGEPVISMITSVQSNKAGITTNRRGDSIIDDESIVSLSDQITQFSSHLFSLRRRTMDEIAAEPEEFGTHRLTCFKYRHLGEDHFGATQPVEWPEDNSKKPNCVFFDFNNFGFEEKGDLRSMASRMVVDINPEEDGDLLPL